MLRRLAISLAAASALAPGALAAMPATASADMVVSSNWAGYAVTGAKYRKVSARWVEPKGNCKAGRPSYASAWVGLGGFVDGSPGLEQTGTDLICTRKGRARHAAWFELIPAPSRPIRMLIRGGDVMSASVTVRGKRVTILLRNQTRGGTFRKKLKMKRPGIDSAEWVVEAPSGCTWDGDCQILPLSDFGATPFTRAKATTRAGRSGTISTWRRSKIILSEGPFGYGASAVPSALAAGGSSFEVAYRTDGPWADASSKRVFPSSTAVGRAPSPHVHLRP